MKGVFDAYASYYDLLYRDTDYAAEAAYVAERIRHFSPRAQSLLELGCGTGAHAEHLARDGFRITGLDLSESMLARAHARKARLPADLAERLDFRRGDIRDERLGVEYDVVVSLFHVMSYQTSEADLRAAFATAAAHLPSGGLFLFDGWYGPAVLASPPEVRVRRLEDDQARITRIAEPALRDGNLVDVAYTVFVEEKHTGAIREFHETHSMRYLFLPELAELAGEHFSILASHAWATMDDPDPHSWAVFLILRKH
jgi:SAM-dependent methyltransferase